MKFAEYVDRVSFPSNLEALSIQELSEIMTQAESELEYVKNQINKFSRFRLFPHLKLVSAEKFEMELRKKELENFIRKAISLLRGNMKKVVGEGLSDPGAGAMDSRDWLHQQQPKQQDSPDRRKVNKHLGQQQRVEFGMQMEKKMIKAMQDMGVKLEPASVSQDMYDKIDAFWTTPEGIKLPVQFKYRDNGDDILLEIIKNWTPQMFMKPKLDEKDFDGRDMKGKSKVYACLNRQGDTIRIRTTKEAKEIAKKMTERLANEFRLMGNRSVKTQYGEIRITNDPANGREKVMAYINPLVFRTSKDLRLKGSLWI